MYVFKSFVKGTVSGYKLTWL